jgi:flagellar basal body-associated protein FliL
MRKTILATAAVLFSFAAYAQTDSLYRGNSNQYHKSDSVGTIKYPSSYYNNDGTIRTDTIYKNSTKTTPVDSTLKKNSNRKRDSL